jgi:Skp family chaperone for outer membrane proteins
LACLIVVGVSLLTTAFGQNEAKQAPAPQAATRIAVCDIGQIFGHCRQAVDLNAELRNRRATRNAEDDKRTRAGEDLSLELQELKPGSAQYEARVEELEKMRIEHAGWRELQELQLRSWHLKMTKEVYGKIVAAVGLVAKEQGIQIVLDQEQQGFVSDEITGVLAEIARRKVLYSQPSADITETVLVRLNEEHRAKSP